MAAEEAGGGSAQDRAQDRLAYLVVFSPPTYVEGESVP